MKRDRVPMLIGIVLGVFISGYALIYAPMHRNYRQCGKITLCAQGMAREARRPKGSGPSGLPSPVAESDAPKGHTP
jgi:hypothetical protein